MNIHGCQLHPKVAIYVVKQLKNDSFRQGLYKQMSVVLIRIPCFGIPCLEHIWDGNESTSIETSLSLEGTNRLPEPLAVQDGDQ